MLEILYGFLYILRISGCIVFSNVYRCIKNSRISSISLGDSLLYVFRGAKEFSPGMQIDIPLFEILIVLYITFIITYYITADQKAVGKNILVISGSASGWWLSKYITMLLAVIIYMAGIFAANTIVGLIMTGSRFSMSLNITGTEAVRIFLQTKLELDFNMPLVIILCFVCLVTMTGISLLLAYISNAVFGFVVNLFFFIVSICSMKWFFFYNYFMTIRIPHVYNRWPYGLCLMLAINILLVAAGIIYSKKKRLYLRGINMYIQLTNVSKKIKSNDILKDINLRMESGKIYGFKGKNGCGKTMLMRAISGLIKVKGTVDINGQIIGKDIMFPPSIGLLIENPSFINNYTAFENLKTLASIRRRIDDNRIRETLTEIGLDPDDKRTFHKFSLGMKQRLGIAAAIMENPDIIILDEPINALDDTGTEQIRDILIRHRERGALIIIACHDADELNFLSDEIIEIVQGQIKPSKDDKKSA